MWWSVAVPLEKLKRPAAQNGVAADKDIDVEFVLKAEMCVQPTLSVRAIRDSGFAKQIVST